jgi:ubiquinone/menaquinone biosynthesis C-methylase UbiE
MTDIWADWIRHRRTGGDPEYERAVLARLATVRDRVLDNAGLAPGETLLDVGCGNGLIGFGALERGAHVVFSDISEELLGDCRALAEGADALDRCRFVNQRADDLQAIEDGSVDVVTTRSVLIYVEDKERAFSEFHRALGTGGRLSLFEPINRFGMEKRRETWGFAIEGAGHLMRKVNAVYEAAQPESDPMLDFDERDLLRLAEDAGFFPITLEYRAGIEPSEPRSWETFLHSSFNPKVPTLAEAMEQVLTAAEREQLAARLRPEVEAGLGVWRMGTAYLWAVKS